MIFTKLLALGEVAGTATGLTDAQASSLANSLQSYGSMLLDNFIKLLPAICVIAAIMFVIGIVRKKTHA